MEHQRFFAKSPWFEAWPTETRGLLLAFWRSLFAMLLLIPLVRRPQWRWADAADGSVLCRYDLVVHDCHGQRFSRQRDLVAVHRTGMGHHLKQLDSEGATDAALT